MTFAARTILGDDSEANGSAQPSHFISQSLKKAKKSQRYLSTLGIKWIFEMPG
jgi:hypothetical protein